MAWYPIFEQCVIVVSGVRAIWLTHDERPVCVRWAPVIGLCGQPMWLTASYTAGQPGMFLVSLAFTVAWMRGVRKHWFKRRGSA